MSCFATHEASSLGYIISSPREQDTALHSKTKAHLLLLWCKVQIKRRRGWLNHICVSLHDDPLHRENVFLIGAAWRSSQRAGVFHTARYTNMVHV